MFASQLLRILQTLSTDVTFETCAFDTLKPKLIMTENQIGITCDSNSSEKKADPLFFSATDPLHTNGHGGNPNSLAYGLQDGHEFWTSALPKSSVLDKSTESSKPEDSPMLGDQDAPWHCFEKDTESFVLDTKDENETKSNHETLHSGVADQSANSNEKKSEDSERSTNAPHAFESDWNPFTDKNVVECEMPEFVVCYQESNIQIVKDICVDEGVPAEEKILTGSEKDDHCGSFVLQPSDEDRHRGTTEGSPDIELFVQDGFKSSSPEDIVDNSVCAFVTEKIDENIADDGTDERSSISSARLSQDFILHDALLESYRCDENRVAQQPDEVPPIEAILDSLAVAFTSEGSKKDGPDSNMPYNSKVESGTITFDFNSSKPPVPSSINGCAEPSPGKAPETDIEKLNDHLAPVPGQLANSEEKIRENSSDSSRFRLDVAYSENGKSDNLSVSSRLQRGEGESSFSTAGPVSGLITYSGPIAYSGNVSLRSDSSTTSTRSFAFPVLQNEWNSSPVRMQKADPRHLRKHKGWRHGLFCCRF